MTSSTLRIFKPLLLAAATAVLGACGGGGGGGGTSTHGGSSGSSSGLPGFLEIPNIFLLFPNSQKQANGSIQTNTTTYATAYYQAIDPLGERTTKAAFLSKNGFGNGATGTELTVVFGDTKDLGYGRRLTARHNNDGSMAFVVDNYLVDTGGAYGYSSVNVDAAAVQSAQRFIGTNAIEFSPGPGGGPNFVKFYNFAPNGTRNLVVDLDGKGDKAMPGICTNCHGGRSDALTDSGAFPTVGNSVSQAAGDVQGRLQALKVSTFDFSSLVGGAFSRANQEASLKQINQWVLESFPLPAPTAFPEDANRPAAGANEWQGTAASFIKEAYGGDGMPNANYAAPGVPNDWVVSGQTTLFQNVVEPGCMTCHILRGNANQSDLDFQTYAKFLGYGDRIKAHVIDRGNMPLAKIVYNDFWGTGSSAPATVATFLEDVSQPAPGPYTVRSGGAVLQPGRPLADPGPNRVVRQGATTLSAGMSLYASGFAWTLISENGGAVVNATLTNANSAAPVFNATADGTYVLRLIATNSGGTASTPANLTIIVDNALAPAPSAITFADIKATFISAGCTACHVAPLTGAGKPPLSYVAADYPGGDTEFYAAVRSRINFTDLIASPLLRKPAGFHHNGGAIGGFDSTATPGAGARSDYDLFLNWILNGAPRT